MPSWKKLISSGSNAHLNAVTASSDIVISQDSKKLMLGAGNDLQIYHDGSNNYIDSTTSDQDLYIRGNDGGSMITAARFDMSDAGTLLPGNNLRMGDSKKIRLGASNDFNLYHDGSDSYIYNESSAGKIIIQNTTSDGDIEIKVNDGGSTTNAIVIDASDNSRVKLPNDNQRLSIGASNDIQITHDGTNSYFDNYTGDLIIKNNADDAGIRLQSDDGSGGTTNYITLDGQFTSINLLQSTALAATKKLFFDGGNGTYIQESSDDILKFYIGGVNLLTMIEGGTNVVKVGDGTYLGAGDSTDLYMYHTAGASFINNGTGMFTIRNQAQDQDIRFSVNDGGVTSNILTLNAASSRVGIGTTAPSYLLHLSGTAPELAFQDTDGSAIWRARSVTNNFHITETGAGDPFVIESGAGANLLVLDSNARVGIGTSGPGEKLHVDGSIEFAGRKYNRGSVSVSGAGTANGQAITLSTELGTTLNVNYQYKITLNTTGTGTDTGAVYILTYDQDGGAWDLRLVSRAGSTSNHPLAVVDGSNLKVYHNHASTYNILYFVEFWDMSADDGTLHGWGSDYQWQRDVDKLYYNDGNVGIGTSSPSYELEVAGTGSFAGIVVGGGTFTSASLAAVGSGGGGGSSNITMDGSTANGLLTYGGTDNIDVESNLTFDGSTLTVNGDIRINDSAAGGLEVGTSQDLQIYHNGTNSFGADNYTGHLIFQQRADDQDIIFKNDDGAGGVTEYLRLDGSTVRTDFDKPIEINDSAYIADSSVLYFGAGNDFRIQHNGTANFIQSYGGAIYIDQIVADSDIVFRNDDGAGSVTTYMRIDGSDERIVVKKSLRSDDNVALAAGTDGDLNLVHNGTDSYVENWNGDLYIRNNSNDKDVKIQSDDNSGGVTDYITLDGSTGELLLTPPTRTEVQGNLVVEGDLTAQNYIVSSSVTYMTQSFSSGSTIFGNSTDDTHQFTGSLFISSSVSPTAAIQVGEGNTARVGMKVSSNRTMFGYDGAYAVVQGGGSKGVRFRTNNDTFGSGTEAMTITYGGQVNLPNDSQKLTLGASQDLELYHDGTNSIINNTTGALHISQSVSDADILFSVNDGGTLRTALKIDSSEIGNVMLPNWNQALKVGASGNILLYHSSTAAKFVNITGDIEIENQADDKDIILKSDDGSGGTTAYLTLDGSATATKVHKNLELADNVQARFGAGDDLQIYHDGSNSVINHAGTGDLQIYQNQNDKDIILLSDDGSGGTTSYITLDGSATQTLFYQNTRLQADGKSLSVGANNDLRMIHDTHSYLQNTSTSMLVIQNTGQDQDIAFMANDNGSNNHVMRIQGATGRVGIGVTSPSALLDVGGDADEFALIGRARVGYNSHSDYASFQHRDSATSGGYALLQQNNGATYLNSASGTPIYFRENNADKMILTGGSVGIGTTSPQEKLDVVSGSAHIRGVDSEGYVLGLGQFANTPTTPLYKISTFDNTSGGTSGLTAGDHLEIYGTRWGFQNTWARGGQGGAVPVASLYSSAGESRFSIYEALNPTSDGTYSERIRLRGDSDSWITNKLGIGTTSPDTTLDVFSSGVNGILLNQQTSDSNTSARLMFKQDDTTWTVYGTGGNLSFRSGGSVGGSSGSEQFRITVNDGIRIPNDSDSLRLGAGDDLRLYHDGTNSWVRNFTGHLYIRNDGSDKDIYFGTSDAGTNAYVMAIDGSEQRVGIGTTSPADKLHVYGASGNTTMRISTQANASAQIRFANDNASVYAGINSSDQYFWYSSLLATNLGMWNSDGNFYNYKNFIASTNNSGYSGRDTGGTVRNVIKIDSSNRVLVGDDGHGGNHLHYPASYTEINTNYGYVQIGAQNSSHMHFITDRSNIYTTSYLNVNNAETIRSYTQDFVATRAGSSTNKLAIESNGTRVYNTLKAEDGLYIKAQSNSGTSNTDGRQYLNVFSYKNTGAVTGAFIIHTDIGRASGKMGKIHVHGHAYGQSEVIDFQVVFYMYSGVNGDDGVAGQPYATSITDQGDDGFNKYLGIDADGNLAIAIDEHNGTSKYYYHFTADMYLGNNAHDPVTDWSGSVSTTDGFNWLHKEAVVPKFHFNSTRYKLQTDNGYIEIGPQNSGYAHYKTDRAANYFDKKIVVDQGIVDSYDEDLILRRAQANSDYISIQDDRIVSYVGGNEKLRVHDTYNYIPQKIYGGDGSEATPMYNFWNDSDSGMYRVGADDIGFTAGGNVRFRANGNGLDLGGTSANKIVHTNTSSRDKIRVWTTSNYAIGMQSSFTFGGLENQYAMTFQMNNQSSERGFWWGDDGHNQAQGAMALTTAGELTVAHSMRLGYGEGDTTTPGASYRLDVSGNGYISGDLWISQKLHTWSSGTGHVASLENNGTYLMLRNPEGSTCIYLGDSGDGQNYYDNGAHRFRSSGGGTYFGTLNSTGLKLGTGYASTKLEVDGTSNFTGVMYIDHGGSDYSPNIQFMGSTNTPGSNTYENALIGYYDNSGTGTMLFEGKRSAMNWQFNDSDECLFFMASDGDFHAHQDVVAFSSVAASDRRLKDNIKTIPNALDKVMNLRGVEFDWNVDSKKGQHDIGLIAQEVEEIIPEVVKDKPMIKKESDGKNISKDEETYKTISYDKLVGLLVESIKELKGIVETQQTTIENQQQQITKLEEKSNG